MCKAEVELWDIHHKGYFGVHDTLELIDDTMVKMFQCQLNELYDNSDVDKLIWVQY